MMTTSEAAKMVGVEQSTLRNWEAKGLISPSFRTAKGHRRYTDDDINSILAMMTKGDNKTHLLEEMLACLKEVCGKLDRLIEQQSKGQE